MAFYDPSSLQNFSFELHRLLVKHGFRLICSDPYEYILITPLSKDDFSYDYVLSDGSDMSFYLPFSYELKK